MIVVDTSVWIDLFILKDADRSILAEKIFEIIENKEIEIYEPRIFVIEFISVIKRIVGKEAPPEVFERINLLDESLIFETAKEVASNTSCRAPDAYFIATTKLTNSILITNDKILAKNAKNYGVVAYYLIGEHEEVIKKLKEIDAKTI